MVVQGGLVKLWSVKGFKKVYYDSDGNLYCEGDNGIYRLEPCTGEAELIDLPVISKVKGKTVKIVREGETRSLRVEDNIENVNIYLNKYVFCYDFPKNDYYSNLKIYDIESGEKLQELEMGQGDSIQLNIGSRYLLVSKEKPHSGKVLIFDSKNGEMCKVEDTFGTGTQKILKFPVDLNLLDVVGFCFCKYHKIKFFMGLKDSLLEYNYDTSTYISEDSFRSYWAAMKMFDDYYAAPSVECTFGNGYVFLNVNFHKFKGLKITKNDLYYSHFNSQTDLIVINLDGEVKHRLSSSSDKIFGFLDANVSRSPLKKKYHPLGIITQRIDRFSVHGSDVILETLFKQNFVIAALRFKRTSVFKKWWKTYPTISHSWVMWLPLFDFLKPFCLLSKHPPKQAVYYGRILNFQDGSETDLGRMPGYPYTFYNGIIIFENGTAYGIKGIFEDVYVEALEKLTKI